MWNLEHKRGVSSHALGDTSKDQDHFIQKEKEGAVSQQASVLKFQKRKEKIMQ